MSKQRRTAMGALESSLETLKILKAKMLDTSAEDHQMHWAIGAVVSVLISKLLQICNDVIVNSMNEPEATVPEDLLRIKVLFSEFMEEMTTNFINESLNGTLENE